MDGAHGSALPPPPPPAPGGPGDGPRRCSQCGHHGHNARTCMARPPVKLFGVRIGDKPIRKSASMGNLAQLAEAGGGGATDEGYGSEGDGNKRQKKRGEAWSEEEHKRFLLGLNKLGKGDWRGISRNYVVSRTPTQVASHAQKYFIRQTNVHRRKKRSSLFDMVIDDSADQPLSRSSSQEVEEYLDDPQPVTAPEVQPALGPVPTPLSVSVPPPVPVMTPPAHLPIVTPVLAPPQVPAIAPQQEEHDSSATSSNAAVVGNVIPEVMPEAMLPYGYPMMLPPPYYPSAFVPVPYYGYVPFFYVPPTTVQASHEVVKPMATHLKPPVNVQDLYSMSELSLKANSSTGNDGPKLVLLPNPIGTPGRQSAFHGKGSSDGPSNGLIPAK